ncbi:vitamin K epoxide reductase family protein [Dysgonomonas sp. ZJ709]|uniref:vitamin K epoxide reductase family protein n=1 Tax=Dysgonomonas sp. ZJ709 TaxID=2709797 RepID=UPI0013E9BCE3|nr:vitamin K epoxide reductase family protein [Dysgonomonas sp. ZJ709]
MARIINSTNYNVFTAFLTLLNVKSTKTFSNKYYNEHPHKYNLYGISKMLSDYRIENAATKIEDRGKNILNIETPFIAHYGGDFALVEEVNEQNVKFIWNGNIIDLEPEKFVQSWSGVVLLAEANENSIEPYYNKNKKKETFNLIQRSLLLITASILIILAYISNSLYNNLGLSLLLLLNLAGVYIGYLLVKKQIHIHSEYSDKICSLFKYADCNDVLESKAAKLWGVLGWSEIGLAYFLANTVIILFFSSLIPYLVIINICSLLYSIWSIWYQRFKVKQWCPLCLIVQFLFGGIFLVNLLFGFIVIPTLNISDIIGLGCIYTLPIIIVNMLTPKLSKDGKTEQITQELNSFKANEEIFITQLRKQTYYEIDKLASNIIFGNPQGRILITVLTNPHCNPCAKMHARIEGLLDSGADDLCIQYIFTSFNFNEKLHYSNRILIWLYMNLNIENTKIIYRDWFNGEESIFFNKEEQLPSDLFIDWIEKKCKLYNIANLESFHLENNEVDAELKKHKDWIDKLQIQGTPTILINGYKLPDNYQIEDLRYFSDLDIE